MKFLCVLLFLGISSISIVYAQTKSTNDIETISGKKVLKAGKFDNLDTYARATPSKYEHDVKGLAQYLVIPATSDLEKTRLIFSWIAFHVTYDVKGFLTGKVGDLSPEGVLKRKNAVCEGYSALFKALCNVAGLEAEQVSGYAKGYGYSPGQNLSAPNHAWDVVKIDGKWKLFDVTWASGYVKKDKGKLLNHSVFNDFWFDCNPDEFIFAHFPEQADRQITGSNITLAQFQNLPYLDDSFFKLGFSASAILKKSVKNQQEEFVRTFPTDYPVNVVKGPYSKVLSDYESISFVVISEYAEEIVAINNGEWIHFKKDGNTFELKIKPKKGTLYINVQFNPKDKGYASFLLYDVKGK